MIPVWLSISGFLVPCTCALLPGLSLRKYEIVGFRRVYVRVTRIYYASKVEPELPAKIRGSMASNISVPPETQYSTIHCLSPSHQADQR
ncbi:hypothetical protein R3P38DRAFT_2845242 [Favolaschia claudopus]|uniref:Secreted protein n=1 Tax=Favolaschia claudopus TaxID=2862362 RepID=A0AAW0DT74_9AGAR